MFINRLVTAEEMRALDACATKKYGIPSLILMENAGRAVSDAALEMMDDMPEFSNVLIIAGPGNNGGDGFVAARHLHNAGVGVTIYYFGDRDKAKGDALTNIEIAEKMGLEIDSSRDLDRLKSAIKDADLIIDALLGTGVKGELRPEIAAVIGCINSRQGRILAVDIPSGRDADTGVALGPSLSEGHVLEDAVIATMTVTFAHKKLGMVVDAGGKYDSGKVIVAEIGIPREELYPDRAGVFALTSSDMFPYFPPRSVDANKGDYGHLAVIAGSVGMTGAAALAAEAALRSGAGLVTVAVPESLNDIMEAKLTEAMTIPVPEGNARAFGMASLDKVLEIINKCDGAAIGPGFGRDADTIAFTKELIRRLEKKSVIDADALYAISDDLSVLKDSKAELVLTPHPGEMARLIGTTVAEVQSNRLEVARKFAADYGVTLVLKGARTIIAEPGGNAFINTTGTPGMATGGAGDVLTGLLGGLLVQEVDSQTYMKANMAVYIHGEAGELAAKRLGESAMIASDVVNCLSDVIKKFEYIKEYEEE
ncbi:MAG: NAD(P)H-hydrate dehydratase [Armatimonadetes bacterium]|nr:NAD(P)H-hydrate dehydratase [Armatimonadota bacterium]